MERESGGGVVCDDKFLVQTMPIAEEEFHQLEETSEDMNEIIAQCGSILTEGHKSAKKSMKLMVDLVFPTGKFFYLFSKILVSLSLSLCFYFCFYFCFY